MGVRVKLKIKSLKSKSTVEVTALLNAGFETESPQVLVPTKVAKMLKFWPRLPRGAEAKTFETAGGIVRMYQVPNAVEVQVFSDGKKSNVVRCDLVISELERQVLVNDIAIDELDIIMESPGKGLWRFRNDTKVRESVEIQYW